MSAMKRLFAVMVAVIGMVIAAASIGVAASAYPPGTGPTIATSTSTVQQGGSLTVTGDHFSPNASVDLSLHSAPVALGTRDVGRERPVLRPGHDPGIHLDRPAHHRGPRHPDR